MKQGGYILLILLLACSCNEDFLNRPGQGHLDEAADIREENYKRIKGEALFLRAHYHFEIWRMWEHMPYYTEEDRDFRKSNRDTNALAYVLEDLENALQLLPEYQASVDDGNPSGENGNRNDRLNFPHAGSPFGCCGFHQPSKNLVNAFKVDEQGLPFLDGFWNDKNLLPEDPVDPRLDWTVGRDGVLYLDWGLHEPDWIRDREWAGPFSPKKNAYEQASGASSSVGWASYQLLALKMEPRLELAMEGQRLFDLRRWGDDLEVLNAYLEKERTRRIYLNGALAYQEKHRLYPLPRLQIQLSRVEGEDRLVQNPGW